MSKTILNFDDIKVKKSAFHRSKYSVDTDEVGRQMKVLFGKKGFKYFLEYKDDDDKIKLLYIMLPRNERICFDETKYMSFLIKMKNC